jgi:GrpB-like predicted nucleotidyltransferase (UPF0157 family)
MDAWPPWSCTNTIRNGRFVFEELRKRIAAALGPLGIGIEHLGSTSVPNICAKPIIDLDLMLRLTTCRRRLRQARRWATGTRAIGGAGYHDDRSKYQDAKSAFIESLVEKAGGRHWKDGDQGRGISMLPALFERMEACAIARVDGPVL